MNTLSPSGEGVPGEAKAGEGVRDARTPLSHALPARERKT